MPTRQKQPVCWKLANAGLVAVLCMAVGCLQPIDDNNPGPDNGDEVFKPAPQKPISKLDSPAKEIAESLRQSRLGRSRLALSMVEAIRAGKSQEELKQLWNAGDLALSKDTNAVISDALKKALSTADADAAEEIWKSVAAGYAY